MHCVQDAPREKKPAMPQANETESNGTSNFDITIL
jgi:hypothetical protein